MDSTTEDFISSWTEIETFYHEILSEKGWDYVKPMLSITAFLRDEGYDKLFRAGKSMVMLVLSRAKYWGLRDDQHSIGIEPTPSGTFNVHYLDGETVTTRLETEQLQGNDDFYKLLHLLEQQPVN